MPSFSGPPHEPPRPRLAGWGALCLAALFALQGAVSVRQNAPTYDEATHVASGYLHLAGSPARLQPENPPLAKSILAAVPFVVLGEGLVPPLETTEPDHVAAFPQMFLYGSQVSADQILRAARASNLLLGVCVVLLTGWWAYRLFGAWASLLALSLAALEPTLVAHASVATTDTAATLFVLLTLYLCWEYWTVRREWLVVGAGVALGLALASKYTTLFLLPSLALILLVHLRSVSREHQSAGRATTYSRAGTIVLAAFAPALVVIVLVYRLEGVAPWSAGLQQFLTLGQLGQPAFFMGQHAHDGWWSYFPVAFLIKTPIGSLVLIAGSLLLARAGRPLTRREVMCLLVPALLLFGVMTTARINIGVRHLLPAYPPLFVLASRVVTIVPGAPRLVPSLAAASLLATAVSVLRVSPHQLSFFNELVGGPEHGHRYLGDSNLDWGQDLKRLKTFLDQQGVSMVYLSYFGTAPPTYYGIRHQYVPGSWPLEWPPPSESVPADFHPKLLAISASHLQELLTPDAPLFGWLREREPIARIGYSIAVFELSDTRHDLLRLADVYRTMGLDEMARNEAEKAGAPSPEHDLRGGGVSLDHWTK